MPTLDSRAGQQLDAYVAEVMQALGDAVIGVVLYGSAAGVDWVAGRSDINIAIVVRRAAVAALDALAPVIARWRGKGFALPVLLDQDEVARASHLFPMELDDIRRQHRLLAGNNPFAAVATDDAALRRECAQEAFGKLLRLRAYYVEHTGRPADLGAMMVDSVKSFLTVIRHLLRLRGAVEPRDFAAVLTAGEALIGPLPAMRRVLEQRESNATGGLSDLAGTYVDEVERLVGAVVAHCA